MAKEVFLIGDILQIVDGKLILGLAPARDALRMEWRNTMNFSKLEDFFEGKKIQVNGEDYQLVTDVLRVQITNSISDFKNVFVEVAQNPSTERIKIKDTVEIDL